MRFLTFPFRFIWRHKLKFSVLLVIYIFCLPAKLFNDPVSTVVLDRNGELLGARIAKDGQWRFPHNEETPQKFITCLTQFEDKRFYVHHGVDPLAMARAIRSNLQRGEVVSGASTLSMQVIRMSRKGKARTLTQKLIETALATRMEFSYSKDEIMALYASNAPFGGNVVGLDAAAWKYYGRQASTLSWAECATLAVLPNSPSLIHPGRNRDALQAKRDRLLKTLSLRGIISPEEYQLSLLEELPQKPITLPNHTHHLTQRIQIDQLKNTVSNRIASTTIDKTVQLQLNDIVNRNSDFLAHKEIAHAGAIVVDVHTKEIIAYVGNASKRTGSTGHDVDMIKAQRSTGSILKPFLYAAAINEGLIAPDMLLSDIPTNCFGYTPKNYDKTYKGAVPAKVALANSLNVPAVRLLRNYGQSKFYHQLQKQGMTTLHQGPDHYGLSLVLGGAETTLEDLATMYTGYAQILNSFSSNSGQYPAHPFSPISFHPRDKDSSEFINSSLVRASAVFQTFNALTNVTRPDLEGHWKNFSSSETIAWKTGTSFGSRDAWAVGCTPDYVVAVWVGNADGEGRPGLTGTQCAAPILFDIFGVLPDSDHWFYPPHDDMREVKVCKHSGHPAGQHCTSTKVALLSSSKLNPKPCPYHVPVFLNKTKNLQVSSKCVDPASMIDTSWFVLPPEESWYFAQNHPDYLPLPPAQKGCFKTEGKSHLQLIYPYPNADLYIPTNLDGTQSAFILKARHQSNESNLYWHLDDEYLCMTKEKHEVAVTPSPGKHKLTVIDELGNSIKREFTVLSQAQEIASL